MRARSKGWRAPRRVQKGQYHWARDILPFGYVGGGMQAERALIEPPVYNTNTSVSPSGVTMVRCIGEFCFVPEPGAINNAAIDCYWAVFAADADEAIANLNPGDGQDLIDERVLAQGVLGWMRSAYGSGGAASDNYDAQKIRFDIRQKVRLHDTKVVFSILNNSSSVDSQVALWGTWAVLLKGDIT